MNNFWLTAAKSEEFGGDENRILSVGKQYAYDQISLKLGRYFCSDYKQTENQIDSHHTDIRDKGDNFWRLVEKYEEMVRDEQI